jgi:hypothetical protein
MIVKEWEARFLWRGSQRARRDLAIYLVWLLSSTTSLLRMDVGSRLECEII